MEKEEWGGCQWVIMVTKKKTVGDFGGDQLQYQCWKEEWCGACTEFLKHMLDPGTIKRSCLAEKEGSCKQCISQLFDINLDGSIVFVNFGLFIISFHPTKGWKQSEMASWRAPKMIKYAWKSTWITKTSWERITTEIAINAGSQVDCFYPTQLMRLMAHKPTSSPANQCWGREALQSILAAALSSHHLWQLFVLNLDGFPKPVELGLL